MYDIREVFFHRLTATARFAHWQSDEMRFLRIAAIKLCDSCKYVSGILQFRHGSFEDNAKLLPP